jgi:hypothetical protein
MCLDVTNFYPGTPMDSFEYMRIPIKLIPQDIIVQYNLPPLVSDGHVYIEVQKGMYGLPKTESLPTNSLGVTWPSMAIIKPNSHRAYGDMLLAPSISH